MVSSRKGSSSKGGPTSTRADTGKEPKKEPNPNQLHPTFPVFQRWVIDRLVGIFANDPTNVVLHVFSRWIDQNEEYLRTRDITFADWRKSTRPQGVASVRSMQEYVHEPGADDADLDYNGEGKDR